MYYLITFTCIKFDDVVRWTLLIFSRTTEYEQINRFLPFSVASMKMGIHRKIAVIDMNKVELRHHHQFLAFCVRFAHEPHCRKDGEQWIGRDVRKVKTRGYVRAQVLSFFDNLSN